MWRVTNCVGSVRLSDSVFGQSVFVRMTQYVFTKQGFYHQNNRMFTVKIVGMK